MQDVDLKSAARFGFLLFVLQADGLAKPMLQRYEQVLTKDRGV